MESKRMDATLCRACDGSLNYGDRHGLTVALIVDLVQSTTFNGNRQDSAKKVRAIKALADMLV